MDLICKLYVQVNFREKSTKDSQHQKFTLFLVILYLRLGYNEISPVTWAGVSKGK